MTISTPRPQRTTAGQTSKFADFSVVSFPHLKKHSIIKTSLINIDPLSPSGAQIGNIKAYGERKKLMVIKTGTRDEMEEISTRFSKESGSEEIMIPERECEYSFDHDIGRQSIDKDSDGDDDEYVQPTNKKINKPTQKISSNQHPQTTTDLLPYLSTSGFDKNYEDDDNDFSRILPDCSPSANAKTKKHKKRKICTSSISSSSDDEREDRWSKNKENLTKSNIDLANLNNKKSKKKKQRTDPIIVEQSNIELQAISTQVQNNTKRIAALEKKINSLIKSTCLDQQPPLPTSNSSGIPSEDISSKINEIFGVDPSTLTSPNNRPTMVMRELYRLSKYDLLKWKDYFEPNAPILKNFIQQKCLIPPEYIERNWTTIWNSMAQLPYDDKKCKRTSTNKEAPTIQISNNSSETTTYENDSINNK